jgi:hypothetical protein
MAAAAFSVSRRLFPDYRSIGRSKRGGQMIDLGH